MKILHNGYLMYYYFLCQTRKFVLYFSSPVTPHVDAASSTVTFTPRSGGSYTGILQVGYLGAGPRGDKVGVTFMSYCLLPLHTYTLNLPPPLFQVERHHYVHRQCVGRIQRAGNPWRQDGFTFRRPVYCMTFLRPLIAGPAGLAEAGCQYSLLLLHLGSESLF